MVTIQYPIHTLLTEGLKTIKESLTRDIKSLSYGVSHYSELHGIYDDLQSLINDPLDEIQDIVGYIEDLEEEALEDLNDIEKALVFVSKNKNKWEAVNDAMSFHIKKCEEYIVLNEEVEKALAEY